MRFWNVYLNGRLIDTVHMSAKDDAKDVYKSLVDHDGYDPRIKVCKARK